MDDPRLRRHLELHVQSGGTATLFFASSNIAQFSSSLVWTNSWICILSALFKVVDYVNKKIVNTPDDKLSSVCEEVTDVTCHVNASNQ